ncbi:vitamin B12 transporter [Chitinophaga dinghuensis]|uniref:Vitamin B12 transporter n=1 Tax=Chitinophaga dinghuensis TaxID=1539050 RepID=A0A327W5P5_9BACT|nr:TonB-dependent receptor [Chitinophaga dinghuensis]RAJ85839.1 vitamin B12 transporter [Chitinophaga dinghuensis]
MSSRIILSALLLSATATAIAQDSSRISQLQGVTVTATKGPQKASETGKVVTILSHEYLQKNSGKTISDILNQQTGLVINGANNTPGTTPIVYMRGAAAGNVLILVDGIPVSDASQISGAFDLNFISPEEVERIEILRGSQSTLYGSDAVAGVINIITRKAGDKPFGAGASLGYGSYNDKQAAANVHGHLRKFSYLAGYKYEKADGFSDAVDTTGHANYDKDGFRQHSVFAKLGLEAGKRWNLQYLFNFSNYHHALDEGAFVDDKDYTGKFNYMLNAIHGTYQFKKGTLHLLYSYQSNNRKIVNDSGYVTTTGYAKFDSTLFTSRTHQAEAYVNVDFLPQLRLVAGAAYSRSTDSQNDFLVFNSPGASLYHTQLSPDSVKVNQISGYADLLLRNLGGFNLEIGDRYNHHSLYGGNNTFTFNPSYLLDNRHKFFANISSGYKVPTLYQLYFPGYGNRMLKPEQTLSYEAGYQVMLSKLNFRATGFYRNTKDLVIFYFDPVTYFSQYQNANRQKAYGAEAELEWNITRDLHLTVNYTYTDGRVTIPQAGGKDTSYYNLYRIPKNAVNASLGYQVTKAFYASVAYKYIGQRYEGPVAMGDYYNLDLYGEYKFGNLLKIFAVFRNITDYKYFDITGFNSRRFNFNAGLQFHF